MNKFLKGVIVTSSVITVGSSLYSLYKYIRKETKTEYKCKCTINDNIDEDTLINMYDNFCQLDYCPIGVEDDKLVHSLIMHTMCMLQTRCDLQSIKDCKVEDDYVLIESFESDAHNLTFYVRKTGELTINRFE